MVGINSSGGSGRIAYVDDNGDTQYVDADNPLPTQSKSLSTTELLFEILTELKKIEYHLAIATDTNLNNQNV